jgi:hypothetical protein
MKLTWLWWMIFLIFCWIWFCHYFFWGFLHWCSLRRLAYSFPFWCVFVWFGDDCNTGFIEWVGSIPSFSILWNNLRRVGISTSLTVW